MKAGSLMEITGDPNSNGPGSLVFSVCGESTSGKSGEEDSSQHNVELISGVHPTEHCQIQLEHSLDSSDGMRSNELSCFPKLEFETETAPEQCTGASDALGFIKIVNVETLLNDHLTQQSKPSNNRIPIVKVERLSLKKLDAQNCNFSKYSTKNSCTRRSEEDLNSCLIICEIRGSFSSPKIQRVFTDDSKSFIKRAFENTVVNELEIVSGKVSEDEIKKLFFSEPSDDVNREERFSDTSITEPQSPFSDDFNDLIEVIETYEDPPSPIQRSMIKTLSNVTQKRSEKFKEFNNTEIYDEINHSKQSKADEMYENPPSPIQKSKIKKFANATRKRSKKFNNTKITDEVNHSGQSEVDEISTVCQAPRKEAKMASKNFQDSNASTNTKERILFECDVCHNTFGSKYSVRDHILAKHPPSENPSDNRPYQCDECPLSYVRRSCLNQHKQSFHSNTPKFQCTACPKIFKRKTYLEYHTMRAHSNAKKYLCQHCGAAFGLILALNEHVSYHHSGKVYTCNVCNKVYKNPRGLVIHSKPRLEGAKPKCRYCEETFLNKCLLQLHLQEMHKESHKFFCQTCDAKFTLKRCLMAHMKHVHEAVRKYPCPLCEKCFKNAAGVKVHLSHTHNDERNFKCVKCWRFFKTRQIYNEHMAFTHPM